MNARWVTFGLVWSATAAVVIGAGDEPRNPGRQPAPTTQPAATQPAPTSQSTTQTSRRPEQMEIIQNLLRSQRSKLILPTDPQAPGDQEVTSTQPATDARGAPLLVDGTLLVERPGRLLRKDEKAQFAFYADGPGPKLRTMEILPNRLLEAMQHEARADRADSVEFVISGEVTRFGDENYLLLRKVIRRVDHGNLAP
jgi:hypothetical protein